MFQSILINFLVSTFLSELLARRNKPQGAKPASLSDVQVPTASETRNIPVAWGTQKLGNPNVVWWGDFAAEPIEKKVRTSLLQSQKIIVGYKYFIGMDMILCHGPLTLMHEIRVNNDYRQAINSSSNSITLSLSWLENDVQTGVASNLRIFDPANQTAIVNSYVNAQTGLDAKYNDLVRVIWPGPSNGGLKGYIGNSEQAPNLEFVVSRRGPTIPNFVSPAPSGKALQEWKLDGTNVGIGEAAYRWVNPAAVLVELMESKKFGAGGVFYDEASFRAAAITLREENHGIAMTWDTQKTIEDVMSEVLRQVNGVLYTAPETGLVTFKLVRSTDTSVATLDDNNIVEFSNFSRSGSYDGINEVRLTYVDIQDDFKERTVIAQDLGGIEALDGQINSATVSYPGCCTATLAAQLAARDLQALSGVLSKVTIKAIPPAGRMLVPGDLVTVNYPRVGISNLSCRVLSADYGSYPASAVTLELVEDIFKAGRTIYTLPPTITSTPSTGFISTPPGNPVANMDYYAPPVFFGGVTGANAQYRHLLYALPPTTGGTPLGWRPQFSYGSSTDFAYETIEDSTSIIGFAFSFAGTVNTGVNPNPTLTVSIAPEQLSLWQANAGATNMRTLARWTASSTAEWMLITINSVNAGALTASVTLTFRNAFGGAGSGTGAGTFVCIPAGAYAVSGKFYTAAQRTNGEPDWGGAEAVNIAGSSALITDKGTAAQKLQFTY